MSYASLEKRIKAVPEEYLDEVSEFLDFILFKAGKVKKMDESENVSNYFGSMSKSLDGMAIQRSMREERN